MKTLAAAFAWTAALALAGAARGTCADTGTDTGANSIRIGLYDVQFRPNATNLTGPYVPPGLNIHLDSVQTLYLAYVRRLASHLDFEFAFGYPPTTKTEGRGPALLGSTPYNGEVISTARWFAPSALLNYEFLSPAHALRPYVGIGINYSTFYDRRTTAAGDAIAGGPTRLSLKASVGPVATAGLSYRLQNHWRVYASYSLSRVRTVLTADTAGIIRTERISFGPQALVVAAGYSF